VDAAATAGASVLINALGINRLTRFDDMNADSISQLVQTNLVTPMAVTLALLPTLRARPSAMIVNIGSVFGSIGHPGYAAYCASKFGLRGFSEALLRELSDTRIKVIHVAPRATRTPMNDAAARAFNERLGNAEDAPEHVAAAIVHAMSHARPRTTLGFPERFFSFINRAFPALVDNAIRTRLPVIQACLPAPEEP
jgi:short-subunit dehydrogenase